MTILSAPPRAMQATSSRPGDVSGDSRGPYFAQLSRYARAVVRVRSQLRDIFPSASWSPSGHFEGARVVEDGDIASSSRPTHPKLYTQPAKTLLGAGPGPLDSSVSSSDLPGKNGFEGRGKRPHRMAATAPATAEYIPSRRSLELCPRSYDVVERAELDTLCVQLEGMPTVRSPSDRREPSILPTR